METGLGVALSETLLGILTASGLSRGQTPASAETSPVPRENGAGNRSFIPSPAPRGSRGSRSPGEDEAMFAGWERPAANVPIHAGVGIAADRRRE